MTATGPEMPIRAMIVDDEPLARERLRSLLSEEPDFQVVGEYGSGRSALPWINRENVDLVFLDIVMPEMDGFQAVRAVPPEHLPHIIFVTVFDTYALQAFDVHAVDYILKPVDPLRFKAALNHVRAGYRDRKLNVGWPERIASLLGDLNQSEKTAERVVLKVDGEIVFLKPHEIRWVESAGNYVTIHLNGKDKLVRETLSSMEQRLTSFGFARISRSAVVNLAVVKTMKPAGFGEYSVRLLDATELTLTRGYREAFFQRIEKKS
jgi:two-component system LytT family response regulator